jgi:hypothetical protein
VALIANHADHWVHTWLINVNNQLNCQQARKYILTIILFWVNQMKFGI